MRQSERCATGFPSPFGKYVLVRDGDAFYRLHADGCDELAMATRFEIFGDSEKGRLCPAGTQVKTNTGKCSISKVERIDEATYRDISDSGEP